MKTCSCLIQNKRSFSDVSEEILPDGKENLKLEAKHKPVIFVYELIALNIKKR